MIECAWSLNSEEKQNMPNKDIDIKNAWTIITRTLESELNKIFWTLCIQYHSTLIVLSSIQRFRWNSAHTHTRGLIISIMQSICRYDAW